MRTRLFGCGKYGWLWSEMQDRNLSSREEAFMQRHKAVCRECARREDQSSMALNMLRLSTLDVEVGPAFDQRILRRHRIQSVKAGLGYWSPALVGGAIAFLAMMAGLQMISESNQLPTFNGVGIESYRLRTEGPLIPTLGREFFESRSVE